MAALLLLALMKMQPLLHCKRAWQLCCRHQTNYAVEGSGRCGGEEEGVGCRGWVLEVRGMGGEGWCECFMHIITITITTTTTITITITMTIKPVALHIHQVRRGPRVYIRPASWRGRPRRGVWL